MLLIRVSVLGSGRKDQNINPALKFESHFSNLFFFQLSKFSILSGGSTNNKAKGQVARNKKNRKKKINRKRRERE